MGKFKSRNAVKYNTLKIIIYLIIFVVVFFLLSSKLFIGESFIIFDWEDDIKIKLASFTTPQNIFGGSYDDDYNYEEALLVTKPIYEHASEESLASEPLVYIYNTHQLETYADDIFENYNIKPNVMMTSYYLKDLLAKNGINAIVETKSVSDELKKNKYLYRMSYEITKTFMTDAKKKYPTIKYFIDLHRDSSVRDKTTTEIDKKTYAKVLFVIGLEHDNYEKNLKRATTINNMIKKYDSSLSRGIYKKEGPGVNGIYNQDFDERVLLIELGGQYNKITEVTNTLDVLSEILTKYIKADNYGK